MEHHHSCDRSAHYSVLLLFIYLFIFVVVSVVVVCPSSSLLVGLW